MKKKGHYAEETYLIVLVKCALVEKKKNQRLYTPEYSLVMLCRHLKYHDENVQKPYFVLWGHWWRGNVNLQPAVPVTRVLEGGCGYSNSYNPVLVN